MANLNLKGSTFFETPCIVQVMTVKLFQVIVLKINALINMRLVIFFYNRVVFWALEGRAMLQIQTNIKGRPHYSVISI